MSEEQEGRASDDLTQKNKSKTSATQKAQKAKQNYDKAKKKVEALKNIKSIAPLISALGMVFVVLIIILLIIGFIGFFTTLPSIAVEKFLEACHNFWRFLWGEQKIEVGSEDINNIADYIESLGYDLVGYGFVSPGTVKHEDNKAKVDLEIKNKNFQQNLYGYVVANERTYTLQGTERGLLVHLFGSIPLVGDLLSAADKGIRDNWPIEKEKYGMIDFKYVSSRDRNDFDVEVDRENEKLKIAAHVGFFGWGRDEFKFNLSGWTSRYGKPVELSLALHLSTMAPDFVYNFCVDGDLQTRVMIKVKKLKYNFEYYYQPNGFDRKISKQEINDLYNNIEQGNLKRLITTFDDSNYIFTWITDQVTVNGSGGSAILYDDCIVSCRDESTFNIYKDIYKALDKDGKPAFSVDTIMNGGKFRVSFDGTQPYFTKVDETTKDEEDTIVTVEELFSTNGVVIDGKRVIVELVNMKMLAAMPYSETFKSILSYRGVDPMKEFTGQLFSTWESEPISTHFGLGYIKELEILPYLIGARYKYIFNLIDLLSMSSSKDRKTVLEKLDLYGYDENGKWKRN